MCSCCSSIKIWKHIKLHLHIHKLSQNSLHDSFSHRRPFKIMPKCPQKVPCYHLPATLRVHGAIFKRHSWREVINLTFRRPVPLPQSLGLCHICWRAKTVPAGQLIAAGEAELIHAPSALANQYSDFSVSNIGRPAGLLPGKWHWELAQNEIGHKGQKEKGTLKCPASHFARENTLSLASCVFLCYLPNLFGLQFSDLQSDRPEPLRHLPTQHSMRSNSKVSYAHETQSYLQGKVPMKKASEKAQKRPVAL